MITKEQAADPKNVHFDSLFDTTVGGRLITWRRNGKTQTWKRTPTRFRIPVKYGLYVYGEITEKNAHMYNVKPH